MKESVKQDLYIQHLNNTAQEQENNDEEIDKEFEALKDTKLNQLFNKIRARQEKEDQQKAK